MKPYGIKHKKSNLGIWPHDVCGCPVCNTQSRKKSKKRERLEAKEVIKGEVLEAKVNPIELK